jgi:lysophospholipase L1-like esterase
LLQTAITIAGGDKSKVFVLSIPDYGYTPFGKNDQQRISKGIDEYNAANEAIAKKLGIKYFNITGITRKGLSQPDLVAFDGLHPSGKMYAEWVKKILSEAKLNPANKPSAEGDMDDDNDGK